MDAPLSSDNSTTANVDGTVNDNNTDNDNLDIVLERGALYRVPVQGEEAPTKLVENLDRSRVMVLNDVVYFTDDSTEGSSGTINTLSVTASPGTTPDVLLSDLDHPKSMFFYEGFLFFADGIENYSIYRFNLDSGEK